MRAKDIMTTTLVTVDPQATVREIAELLLERQISAVPVVDTDGNLLGIVSEGDLIRRDDIGTAQTRSWWLRMFVPEDATRDYVKTHGRTAADVMTTDLVTVDPETKGAELAKTLERHRIKRVLVTEGGKLVGIVSRANLLHGLAAHQIEIPVETSDEALREELLAEFGKAGVMTHLVNLVVKDGQVHLFGAVRTQEQKTAMRIAAENLAGEGSVVDEVTVIPEVLIPGY